MTVRMILLLVLLSASIASPAQAQVPEATSVMPARDRGRLGPVRVSMLASGGGALVVGWLGNALISSFIGFGATCDGRATGACIPDFELDGTWRSVREYGWIPIVGPWAQLAAAPGRLSDRPWLVTQWVASGIVQAAGVGLLLAGALLDEPPRAHRSVRVIPMLSPAHAGLSVDGRF